MSATQPQPRRCTIRPPVPPLDTLDTRAVRQCARLAIQTGLDALYDAQRAIDHQSILGARGAVLCAKDHCDLAHSLLIQLTRLTEDRD